MLGPLVFCIYYIKMVKTYIERIHVENYYIKCNKSTLKLLNLWKTVNCMNNKIYMYARREMETT